MHLLGECKGWELPLLSQCYRDCCPAGGYQMFSSNTEGKFTPTWLLKQTKTPVASNNILFLDHLPKTWWTPVLY